MSSGPNRPSPLAQFTPGDPRVGLVTGHRLPNTVGAGGTPLNEEVLALMRAGAAPAEAVAQVADDNPTVDGGLIALSLDGRICAKDTAYVARFPDRNEAVLGPSQNGCVVAVLHNAIRPHRSLATLVAEVALDRMDPPDVADDSLRLNSGVPVERGEGNAIHANELRTATFITVGDPKYLHGRWSMGMVCRGRSFRELDRGARTLRALSRPLFRPRGIDGRG